MIDLKYKNAFITGSSRGIGQQIALGLARLGCNIIVHGRNKYNCNKTLVLLKQYPVKTYIVYGELSEEALINSVIKQVKELNISIDVLYNNAAVMPPFMEDIWGHKQKDWIKTFNVNVYALYKICGAFIPEMINNDFGRVVNLTSGIKHVPELSPYGSMKWAVNKLTDDISIKLVGTNVKINLLDPGWLRTDMGGENADYPVEAVLPGALAPALLNKNAPNGVIFSAINHNLDLDIFK